MVAVAVPGLLAHAAGKSTAVVPRIRASAGISDAFRTSYDARLRAELEAHVAVADAAATKKALAAATTDAERCEDAACAKALTESSGARFAVLGMVSNDEEIYTVTLAVYDSAQGQTTGNGKAVCELCGVAEVEAKIADAVTQIAGALAAAAPIKPPADPEGTFVKVQTDPPGALVFVDDQQIGETPLNKPVTAGAHVVVMKKEGYDDERREIRVSKGTFEIDVPLKVQAETTTPVTTPVVEDEREAGPSYAAWGWGLALGGAVATGLGAWLIILDGTPNCDTLGRRECPHVYDTKAGGMGAFGLGAAAMGVGITLLILDPGGVPAGEAGGTVEPMAEGGALFRYTLPF